MSDTEVRAETRAAGTETVAPDVSVVVTVFNEASCVDELYRRALAALDDGPRTFELIFIDDGSTDGTFAALERLHCADPRVRAVRFKRNFGQHPAMHAGLARARSDIVVTMDGDLQNDPRTSHVSSRRSRPATTSPAAGGACARIRSGARCRHA